MSLYWIVIIACVAIFLLGLLSAISAYQRARGARRIIRGIAVMLFPVGLYLAGQIDLLVNGIQSLIDWANRTVLTLPLIIGMGLIGLSIVLWLGAGLIRPVSRQESKARREARALKHISKTSGGNTSAPRTAAPSGDDDADVEALLKKRGIE